jgi:hypothetical protein
VDFLIICKNIAVVLLGVAGYSLSKQEERYSPPLLASAPVPMLTQIRVSPLFWVPGMTTLPIKEASSNEVLGAVVLLQVLQNKLFSPFYLLITLNEYITDEVTSVFHIYRTSLLTYKISSCNLY